MFHSSILDNLFLSNSILVSLNELLINLQYFNSQVLYNNLIQLNNYMQLWVNAVSRSNLTYNLINSLVLDSIQNLNLNFNVLNHFKNIYLFSINYYLFNSIYLNSYITQLVIVKNINLLLNNNFLFNIFIFKWFYLIVIINFLFFFSNILNYKNQFFYTVSITIFQKISDLGEQEYGAFDDFQFLLIFIVYVFSWYCWVLFSWYFLSLNSSSWLMLSTIIMTITILTIPVQLLINFGAAFVMYVRGAASSSNIVVEALFDLIGIIIIFTRFIIQNIRLVLVFVAYFELFEWVVTSLEFNSIVSNLTLNYNLNFAFLNSNYNSLISFFLTIIKLIITYLYHLLHLIVVSFMQIGIYLMISFWLFFFLYTSFTKLNTETYFKSIR